MLDPAVDEELFRPEKAATADQLPLLVLGAGANGANNHVRLLEMLLPLAGRVRVGGTCWVAGGAAPGGGGARAPRSLRLARSAGRVVTRPVMAGRITIWHLILR